MKENVTGTTIPTMLPTTCGEETDLPGVPRVGCVAAVSCHRGTALGVSASVIATADSVALLGPDLDQRRHGGHCLFTRHVWRPASLVEAAAASAAATGQSAGTVGSASLSSSPSSPLTAATTAGMLAHTDGGGVTIIALTACPLAPAADTTGPSSSGSGSGGVSAAAVPHREDAEGGLDDVVAVVVAWADMALHHHVTVLSLHLRRVLTPSWPGYDDGMLVRIVAQDALSLPSSLSVLQLFFNPAMTAPPAPPSPTADGAEAAAGERRAKFVVMCSVYSSWSATGRHGHAEMHHSATTSSGAGGVAGIAKKTGAPVMGTSGGDRASANGSPNAAASAGSSTARRQGALLYLTVAATQSTAAATDESVKILAGPSALEDVAPWLLNFQTDRVVCAFTVQSVTTRVIAAAGTTDGRVFLIGPTSQRLVRRVSGPVADAVFARTRPARAESAARNAVVDDLLTDAIAEDTLKNGSFTSAADVELARRDESEFVALVVLDSAGHLIVLRAVNSGAPITQMVSDLPQVITLADGQKQTLTFVSPSMTHLDEEAQISSRNFLDLSTLRHFIGRRRTMPPRKTVSASSVGNAGVTMASSSLTATPVNNSFAAGAAAGAEEATMSGHILSRGLLCVTNIDWGKGSSELVVSTMGQVVVSVPFSPTEGCFRIAGFTVTPAPMFYVGFVDFFADGNPTLVMAGLKNVLVASRPQSTIRERAQLLLRLLSKKERERHHTDSDDGVDA